MDKNQAKKDSFPSQTKQDSEIGNLLKSDCNIQYGGISSKDDDVPLIGSDSKDKSKSTKILEFLTTLTIEPVMFCFMFAFIMNLSIMPNLMMDKSCQFYFNYSEEICGNISYYKTEKQNVEKLTTTYSLYSKLTSLIAAFLMCFIAPWSDKYGRKIPLLVSVAGAILTDIGIILCASYLESSLLYIVASQLPCECAGGFICMLTIIFSHASEVSSTSHRTLKYTTVEIALGLGMSFGGLTGGFLYRYYGYLYVYTTVACMHLFCFIWILWIVEETTGLDVNMKCHEKAKDFFSCESFKGNVAVTFKAREGNTRALLMFMLASMCMIILNYEAFGTIAYVYVFDVYFWDPATFNVAFTTSALVGIVLTSIAVPILIKVFKIRDYTLGIIGVLSMIGRSLFNAFSKYHTYLYYTGLAVGIFTPLSTLAVRSGISKLVAKEELGRVFSFLATCEAIIPMLGTIVVTQLFNATINVFPNVTYTFGACLLILPLGTFIWALKSTKPSYSELSVSVNDDVKEKA